MQARIVCPRPRIDSWLLLAALFMLVCCSVTASAATTVVTDTDKGATVNLKMGDTLEVRLNSNPTTGYQWSVDLKSTTLLKLTSQSQIPSTQPGVGRPSVQIFKFQPTGKGTGVLLLDYTRSWQKADPSAEQFNLHVSIQ